MSHTDLKSSQMLLNRYDTVLNPAFKKKKNQANRQRRWTIQQATGLFNCQRHEMRQIQRRERLKAEYQNSDS